MPPHRPVRLVPGAGGRGVSLFADAEAAAASLARLDELAGFPVGDWIRESLADNADPDRALVNLERWVRVTSSPSLHLQQMIGMPRLGALLLTILGASQPVADALIQNPEFASLALEPGEMAKIPSKERIVAEGRRLLQAATSFSHSLDRLRYLKQRYTLPLVLNDLSGSWSQETVWSVLSDLADALIALAWKMAWDDLAARRGLPSECPVLVVAFGKLAGRELNYSSDVDLVYVVPDGMDEALERDCARFCESLGRVLSERMGRGSLYRVDLRLRPYGGAGPIVRSMRSYQAYYRLYAEPWEIQALLRSRPVVGPSDLAESWETMRQEQSFRARLSDITLEHLLAMRQRIEQGAVDDDLKRAAGGIRDVEFYVQVLQMLHGHAVPALRDCNTLAALRTLDSENLVEHTVCKSLIEGYTFLRKLEHRLQLVGDQQTHEVPAKPMARRSLARTMDFSDWPELEKALMHHRRTIHTLYKSTFHLEEDARIDRTKVIRALGSCGQVAAQWFDMLPESDAFYSGLAENEGSLHRVQRILFAAPKLVTNFRSSLALTEMLMSGEIEEEVVPSGRIDRLPPDAFPEAVAEAHLSAVGTVCARWVLGASQDLGRDLTEIYDALMRHILGRFESPIDLIALGSYGSGTTSSRSDVDILMLVASKEGHPQAEAHGQEILALIDLLHRLGSPIKADLRLRPEGGKGLLVRTYEGFRAYDAHGMEMWERFALGQSRLVKGDPMALELVHDAAYTTPLTPERLRELTKMKKRIENERVPAPFAKRHVKLGAGGLNDIEWLVHLHEMRYPSATQAGSTSDMPTRIRKLGQVQLLNSIEVDVLLEALRHLLAVRNYLDLQGYD
ncbi:MAG TPA: hypothetical protein VGE01_02525, partial [Fimbriimonas sp.]